MKNSIKMICDMFGVRNRKKLFEKNVSKGLETMNKEKVELFSTKRMN